MFLRRECFCVRVRNDDDESGKSDLFSLDIFHWKKWRHFFNPTYTQHARSLSLSLSLSKQKDIRARRRDDEGAFSSRKSSLSLD